MRFSHVTPLPSLAFGLALSVLLCSELTVSAETTDQVLTAPAFEAFRTSPGGVPARDPDFSLMPAARSYRTAIRSAAKDGTNFAGGYVLTTWGCGSNCVGIAMTRGSDGKVVSYIPAFGADVRLDGVKVTAPLGLDFRSDSKLLVINPIDPATGLTEKSLCERTGTVFGQYGLPLFFVWENEIFRHVTPDHLFRIRTNCLSCCGDDFLEDRR